MTVTRIYTTLSLVPMLFMLAAAVVATDARDFTAKNTSTIVGLTDLIIDPNTGERIHAGQPFTGEARAHAPNGQLTRADQFVQGRRHGSLRMWFESGKLAFDSIYRGGKREGLTKSWWSNGNPRSTTTFSHDQPHGVAWSWYPTGEQFKRYNYANGQPAGLQKAWRKNGKLFSNFEYRNGRAYGLRNANMCVGLDDETIKLSSI